MPRRKSTQTRTNEYPKYLGEDANGKPIIAQNDLEHEQFLLAENKQLTDEAETNETAETSTTEESSTSVNTVEEETTFENEDDAKDALYKYALERFGEKIDKRTSLATMQKKVDALEEKSQAE